MRRVLLWMMCLTVTACSAPSQDPAPPAGPQRHGDVALAPIPFEDTGACPFEECAYGRWSANDAVDVRADRRGDAPVAFSVASGERVEAVAGVVVTTNPGRVRFRKQVDLPSEDGAIHVEPGEDLGILSYHREGFFTAAFQGVVYRGVDGTTFMNAACERQPHRCIGEIVERPDAVWWVQIADSRGRTGWTNEPHKFDGSSPPGDRSEMP